MKNQPEFKVPTHGTFEVAHTLYHSDGSKSETRELVVAPLDTGPLYSAPPASSRVASQG